MQRTSILKDNFYTICAILAGFILFGLVGAMDAEDKQAQLEHYCEMVKLHKQDPSVGWPDYDGIYDTACRKQKGRSRMSKRDCLGEGSGGVISCETCPESGIRGKPLLAQ